MALSKIVRITDPRRRAEAAADYLAAREEATETELKRIRQVRDAAANEMLARKVDGKWQYRPADVARALRISRASVSQRFEHASTRDGKSRT